MDKLSWVGNYEFKLVSNFDLGRLDHFTSEGWALVSQQHEATATIYIFARPK